jgi:two-component system chemotaxis response regulator CheY
MRILIVDDSKAMRMMVARALRLAGFRGHAFEEAPDGTVALCAIRTAAPDLVLCDWNMPNMNGLELLEELQTSGPRVRFGFVTSECGPVMRHQALNAGALFLVTKPFTPEIFERTLASVL